MAVVSLAYANNLYGWLEWKRRIENMSTFSMPEDYVAFNLRNKYDRFTGYLKEWEFRRLKSTYTDGGLTGIWAEEKFTNLAIDKEVSYDRLWKDSMSSGGNRKIKNTMPHLKNRSFDNKEAVYDLFMPLYRALKDSYDNRSIFEWFTNHSQYTAERDSIKAIEGIMRSLTGDSIQTITQRLSSMRESMPIANYQQCFNYEKERLERLEAAQRIEKNNLAIDNNKVEHIVIEEAKEENIIANTENIVETDEKNIEKII